MKKKIIGIGSVVILLAVFSVFFIFKNKLSDSSPKVMGSYRDTDIYLSDGYSQQGMISLTSVEEPVINISSYTSSGMAKITLYKAEIEDLLTFLVHDEEFNQVNPAVDLSKLKYVTTIEQEIKTKEESRIILPLEKSGIWVAHLELNEHKSDSFIVRSEIGAVAKEAENRVLVWSQNYSNRRSVNSGEVKVYNLSSKVKKIDQVGINGEGIAEFKTTADAEVAVVKNEDSLAVIPINIRQYYSKFLPKTKRIKTFAITDRPIYQPGDEMNFKSIIRDDDDARYSIDSKAVVAKIYKDWEDPENLVMEKNLEISSWGSIDGTFQLPKDLAPGSYVLRIEDKKKGVGEDDWYDWENGRIDFQVEYYQKPEYSIDIETPNKVFVSGDKGTFKIKGNYLFGQPLAGRTVEYKIYLSSFYEYENWQNNHEDINDEIIHYSGYNNKEFLGGKVTLDDRGEAVVNLDAILPENIKQSQIMTISAKFQDETEIPVISQKNVLVYRAEYSIYRLDRNYRYSMGNSIPFEIKLDPHRSSAANKVSLEAKLKRTYWIKEEVAGRKYPNYRREVEDYGIFKSVTDENGKAQFAFKLDKPGSYNIVVDGKDRRGNLTSGNFHLWVPDKDDFFYGDENQENNLSLGIDQEEYLPNDIAKINLSSNIPNRDVLITFQRDRVNRYQIVHLSGNTAKIDVPLLDVDMPNVFVRAVSFSDDSLDTDEKEIIVSADSKRLKINITAEKEKYAPGDKANINVSTVDSAGNPVSAEVAVWLVDKAIYELADNNVNDIFSTFWQKRYGNSVEADSLEKISYSGAEKGGCFAGDTQILMKNKELKNIKDIKSGEIILTRKSENDSRLVEAKIVKTITHKNPGYLLLNGQLKITPDHKIWVEGTWKTAQDIKIGDYLVGLENKKIEVNSIEWQLGEFDVYNLEIEKYHTFFADGIWVHNEKGGGEPRSDFKDTAYWNPSVKTDDSGKAKISFRLPDNLTTWTISAIGATKDTKVGKGKGEVLVTKDVIIRPILPNVLREGDEIILSALVHNFTNNQQQFKVELKFENGEIDSSVRDINLLPKTFQQVNWKVRPRDISEKAPIAFSVIGENKKISDTVIEEIPVREMGYWDQRAEVGSGEKTFIASLSADSSRKTSSINLSLGSSLFGTLPSAMTYLVDYPYGCVEQTTSKFVPVVIAKRNLDLLGDWITEKPIDDMIKTGVERLGELQAEDGSWAWWRGGLSDSYVTAYVVEYLVEAKKAGIGVDENVLEDAKNFLVNNLDNESGEIRVIKIYGLTMLGASEGKKEISQFDDLSSEIVSLAIIANAKNGFSESAKNGLNKLDSLKNIQGNSVFWKGGKEDFFGSDDASTALAVRAIIAAGGNTDLADQAIRFLAAGKTKHYWSNTYATAQIIRAMVDYSRSQKEINPNFSYQIYLDDEIYLSGQMKKFNQTKEIKIPNEKIKLEGSQIRITKNGDGQIYSTLFTKEYHKNKEAQAYSNGIEIEREYFVDKPTNEPLKPGDVVTVILKISGYQDGKYLVIQDYLPSGLVPINPALKNEEKKSRRDYYRYSNYDYLPDGVIMYLNALNSGEGIFAYKARVINDGNFYAPPATVSFMYQPEVYGRTAVQNIKDSLKYGPIVNMPLTNWAQKINSNIPVKNLAGVAKKASLGLIIITPLAVLIIAGIIAFIRRRILP